METNEEDILKEKNKQSLLRKGLKILFYFFLGLIGLNILIYLLLWVPSIQRWTLDFAIQKLKPIVKTEVSIDRIQLLPFYHLHLEGVYLEDQQKDTLVYASNLTVDFAPLRLLNKELLFEKIELSDFMINVSQEHSDSVFNFQFLVDAFASDTEDDGSKSALDLVFKNVKLNGGSLNYDINSEEPTPGVFNGNHIRISDLDLQARLNSIDMKKLDVKLKGLSFKEHSGLHISNFATQVKSVGDSVYWNELILKLPQTELNFSNGYYNLTTNKIDLNVNKSLISIFDLRAFLPSGSVLAQQVPLLMEGHISAKLPTIELDSLLITSGEDIYLRGDAFIGDVSKYYASKINLDIEHIHLSPKGIGIVIGMIDSSFIVPDVLKDLGDLRFKGGARGTFENLDVKADLWSKQGALQLESRASVDSSFQKIDIGGSLSTQNFNLGELFKISDLGRLTTSVNFAVKQTNADDLNAQVSGKIHDLDYLSEKIRDVILSINYNKNTLKGTLTGDTPLGVINGDFEMRSTMTPQYKLNMEVAGLKVNKFYTNEKWVDPQLSFKLVGDVRFKSLNDLSGFVYLNDIHFTREGFVFEPGIVSLEASVSDSVDLININSSIADFKIEGKYDFNTIEKEVSNMLHEKLPSIFDKYRIRKGKNDFVFSGQIKNTSDLSRVFDLPVTIDKPILLSGNIAVNSNQLNFFVDAPSFLFGEINIKGTKLGLINEQNYINLEGTSSLHNDSNSVEMNLVSLVHSDSIAASLIAKSDLSLSNQPITADLDIIASFEKTKNALYTVVDILPSLIGMGELQLAVTPSQIASKDDIVEISNFMLTMNDNPYLVVDGVVSASEADTLSIHVHDVQLGDLLKVFDVTSVSALADGNIFLTKVLGTPELYTPEFKVEDIVLFEDSIGSLSVSSRWNGEKSAIALMASLTGFTGKESMIGGLYSPQTDSLQIGMIIEQFPLRWTRNFFPGLLNELDGTVSANLSGQGVLPRFNVLGWVGANDLKVGVDYTNVTYSISDTIQIDSTQVGFKNVAIQDPYGNKALADASLSYNDKGEMNYKLDMAMENFLILNTQTRTDSLFYGRVFASGDVNIRGNSSTVKINVDATNEKNSQINIQLPSTSEAADYDGIVYINVPQIDSVEIEPVIYEEPLLMNLGVKLALNPDIALGVILDPLTGDEMKIQGSGKINFSYDSEKETMSTFGDYILSSGSVKLKLQKIASMEFRVQEGSRLRFTGDPMQTSFDIKAYKRVRADLATLDESFSYLGLSTTRVPVNCIINIKGNINKMDISYEVSLPEASDDIDQKVRSLIITDEQKLKQFAYLVAFGSFYSGGNVGDGMLTSIASSTISGGLNAIFGNMLGNQWEIGTDIASSDGSFSDIDVNVNVSRKFLDGKLRFNTSLGYQSTNTVAGGNENPFIGDFELEYELSPMWKVKAYSKTNDELYRQSSTTQGVGLVYTKDARTLKELFRFFGSKKNKKNEK